MRQREKDSDRQRMHVRVCVCVCVRVYVVLYIMFNDEPDFETTQGHTCHLAPLDFVVHMLVR